MISRRPSPAARVYFFFGVPAGLFPAFFGLSDPAKLDRAFSWASLREVEHGAPMASWARTWLLVQAVAYAIVGALLLFAREAAADAWPWAVTETVAQFYGGAFLGLAYVSWHSARRRTWTALVAVVPPFLVFAVVTIVVSLVHGELFDGADPAAWAWFAFFGASAAAFAAMLAVMVRMRQFAGR